MEHGRLHWFEPGELDDAQRGVHALIAPTPRPGVVRAVELTDAHGRLHGPFNSMLLNPAISEPLVRLTQALRRDVHLTDRERELAILVIARFERSEFEWYTHELLGRAGGLTVLEIAAVLEGEEPDTLSDREAHVYAVAGELAGGDLAEDEFRRGVAALGEVVLADLVTLAGFFQLLALAIRVWRVPLPDGAAPVFS